MTTRAFAWEDEHWCDVYLEGITWAESGRDVVIRVRRRTTIEIVCRWAEATEIRLEIKPGIGGSPLSWDGEIARLPDGRISVRFDFASTGELRLVCSEIDVSEHVE
jgi:hypothetical protein